MTHHVHLLVGLVASLAVGGTALAAPPVTETTLKLKVTSVHDGDTFTGIDESNQQMTVRLNAVDAPQLSQPYGQAS
jgi:endonuclease YncB( thermonuclease family)